MGIFNSNSFVLNTIEHLNKLTTFCNQGNNSKENPHSMIMVLNTLIQKKMPEKTGLDSNIYTFFINIYNQLQRLDVHSNEKIIKGLSGAVRKISEYIQSSHETIGFSNVHEEISNNQSLKELPIFEDGSMDWSSLCCHIGEYGLSEEKRIEYARQAVLEGIDVSSFIQNFKIKSEAIRIEIAKLTAEKFGWGVSKFIRNFDIRNERERVEIAKLAAFESGGGVSEFIQNYELSQEPDRTNIARIAAQQNGECVSFNIQNYDIKDEKTLFEIAKLAAQQDGRGTSRWIKNYGICDEAARIEIAKLAADQDGEGTSENIENFDLMNEVILVEIAKRSACQNGWGTSEFIHNYGIQGKEALVQIAKLAAQQSGRGISEHIKNYGIREESIRIEIAMLAAKQSGEGISEYIENYEISDEGIRADIAKLAAQQNGARTSKNIQNYKIQNEQLRAEIAKIAACQSGFGVSKYIQNYHIKTEALRVEIARLAAQEDGWGTSEFIQRYGISEEAMRIQIAELAIKNHSWGSSEHIHNYRITNEEALLRLARSALLLNPLEVSKNIQHYEIKNEDERCTLFKYAIRLDSNCIHCIGNFHLASLPALPLITDLESIEKHCKPEVFDCFASFIQAIKEEKNDRIKAAQFEWLAYTIKLITLFGVSPNEFPYWKSIFEFRNVPLRLEMAYLVCELLHKKLTPAYFVLASTEHMKLLSLFLLELQEKDRSLEEGKWVKSLKKAKEFCRDKIKLKILLDTLSSLARTKKLSQKEQFAIMEAAFKSDSKKTCNLFFIIQGLIQLGQIEKLKETKDFETLFQEVFKDFIPLKKEYNDFGDVYLKEFGSCRMNTSLFIYAARLKRLAQTSSMALDHLAIFLESVLDGTFYDKRYDQAHLHQVFNGREELKRGWKQGGRKELKELREGKVDYLDFFKLKILEGRLDPIKYPLLKSYLDDPSKTFERKEGAGESFQKEAMALMQCKGLEGQIACLKKMSALLAKEDPKARLIHDIEGVLADLIRKKKYDSWVLVDTDHFWDLFRSGTDVTGSCLRADGDPEYSKCLLTYLLDGKIRLFAIKDEEGKIVVRSIVRILWDEQTESPILLQERMYPDAIDGDLKRKLNAWISERAKELKLRLFLVNNDGLNESVSLRSFKGNIPWEYVDSIESIREYGDYTIEKATLVEDLIAVSKEEA